MHVWVELRFRGPPVIFDKYVLYASIIQHTSKKQQTTQFSVLRNFYFPFFRSFSTFISSSILQYHIIIHLPSMQSSQTIVQLVWHTNELFMYLFMLIMYELLTNI